MRFALLAAVAMLGSCEKTEEPPEVTLRHCMGNHARALPAGRRPTFEEATEFARDCGALRGAREPTLKVDRHEVSTLACAYSQQWERCGRQPPTD